MFLVNVYVADILLIFSEKAFFRINFLNILAIFRTIVDACIYLKKVVVCYFYRKIISGAVIQKVTKIENNNVKTKKKQEQNKIAFS